MSMFVPLLAELPRVYVVADAGHAASLLIAPKQRRNSPSMLVVIAGHETTAVFAPVFVGVCRIGFARLVSAPLTTLMYPTEAAPTVTLTVVPPSLAPAFFHHAFCAAVEFNRPAFPIAVQPEAVVDGMVPPRLPACITSRSFARTVAGIVNVSVPAAAVVADVPAVRIACGSIVYGVGSSESSSASSSHAARWRRTTDQRAAFGVTSSPESSRIRTGASASGV